MNIRQKIKNSILYLDGGFGTMLQSRGLAPGELPETWNILHPEVITGIACEYLEAGANVASACTFGVNRLKYDGREGRFSVCEVVSAAVKNARKAVRLTEHLGTDRYVALDIGPTGKLLRPLGDLDFEEAVDIFAEVIRCGAAAGADLILIETMNDSYESKAALLAAKENCDLPVILTNVYDSSGKLMTGADPVAMTAMLEGMGADAIGMNCSLGPKQMKALMPIFAQYASVPIAVSPNAGMPKSVDGKTVYDVGPEEFAEAMADMVRMGARIIGGCCGTTPEYIRRMVEATRGLVPASLSAKEHTLVSSFTHAVVFGPSPVLIGERINPTGKKRLKQALRENDMSFILGEAVSQDEAGAHILDVNVGLPELDEPAVLAGTVRELQSVIDLPLQLDTSDPAAMERALRTYNGKAMINSVNGKEESMSAIFPLAAKYGGVIVALTLDEGGIPASAAGRLDIARRIISRASEYGIDKKDIIFDPLAMAVSSDASAAVTTLESISLIKNELGAKTSLGVSNVSFGLPNRDYITSAFFAMALHAGLNAAIMNPHSAEMMKIYHSYLALSGLDESCAGYIDFASRIKTETSVAAAQQRQDDTSDLKTTIVKGLKERSGALARELLSSCGPMDIINGHIIPALDEVGRGFEKGSVYLPQLLMSADAASAAFESVKSGMELSDRPSAGKVIVATVKGDIHDIGKNIVRVLLENYGFDVIDLGKDVPPEIIADRAAAENIKLVGLSALMTTTVPSMEATIKLLREKAPWCKVVVGGAVLTQEYADMIGADFYARDAMETVRCAERVLG